MSKMNRVCLLLFCVLIMSFSARSRAGDSFHYSVTCDDQVFSLIPQPELGYVVQSQNDTGSISMFSETIQLFGDADIRTVKGLEQRKTSVVFNQLSAENNEIIVEALKSDNRIRFVAPLYSLNGQTVAVIPEIIVRISRGTDLQTLEEICGDLGLNVKKRMEFTSREYLLEVLGTDAEAVMSAVEQLKNNSLIEWAVPNIAFEPQLAGQFIPNDEYFWRQWDLHNRGQARGTINADINAPEAWTITTGDPNIIVAVLDTGVDMNHPDLINNLVPGYDVIENDYIPEPDLDEPSQGHGTNCAGLVAAQGNNEIGIIGVAWNCKVMPVRIIGVRTYTTDADIATAIRWAAENGADILSNSWGSSFPSQAIYSAIVDITEFNGTIRDGKGCVVFCASGNWAEGGPVAYPAAYPEVMAVGATDHDDEIWYYSGSGPELDIVAPSGGVQRTDYFFLGKSFQWTTDITGISGYSVYNLDVSILDYSDTMGGTSGACPIAAGIAALVLSIDPNLTNDEVRAILMDSAVDLGQPGFDERHGYGRVDAFAAVERALNPPPPPPSEAITLYIDDDAPNDPGPGDTTVSDANEDGSAEHPFDNIQEAVDNAVYAETVIVLPGIYTGQGNYNIDFNGKAVKIRSREGPENTVVDCQSLGRGFFFHNREKADSVLDGFTIKNGSAYFGGGVSCQRGSSPTVANCIFVDNWARSWGRTGGVGGGMYNDSSSNPTITNCKFISNMAVWNGGGIYNEWSSPVLTNCVFNGNLSGEYGGGMYNDNGRPMLTSCTFENNAAETRGGGIYNNESNPTLTNCLFRENLAVSWDGGGIFNIGSSPMFVNCTFIGNTAGDWGGAMTNFEGYPILTNCSFIGNSAATNGGGIYNDWSELIASNCIFSSNSAGDNGGSIFSDGSLAIIENCTFVSNISTNGNAFAFDSWWYSSELELSNSILWDGPEEIWINDDSIVSINYSDIMTSGEPWDGIGNINADPLFADPGNGDYHLKSQAGRWNPNVQCWVQDEVTSPCIDAGNPNDPVNSEPVPNGNRINMGAYGGTMQASMSVSRQENI